MLDKSGYTFTDMLHSLFFRTNGLLLDSDKSVVLMVIRVNHVERQIQRAMCKLDGARKKYHSGTKCFGVSIGSAGIQLSG